MRLKWLLGGLGLAAVFLTAGSAPAYAQRWEDCRDRIRHAEMHLDRMIERFGRHSGPARDARIDLERTRDWCYRHHRRDWDRDWHDHGPPPPGGPGPHY